MYKKQLLMILAIFTLIFSTLLIKTNAYNYVSGNVPVVDVLPSASADIEGYIYKLSTDNKYYICEETTVVADKEFETGDVVSGKQIMVTGNTSSNFNISLSDGSMYYRDITGRHDTQQFSGVFNRLNEYFNITGDNVTVTQYKVKDNLKCYIKDAGTTISYTFVETDVIPLDIDNALDEVLAILPVCVPVMVGFLAIRKGISFITSIIKSA